MPLDISREIAWMRGRAGENWTAEGFRKIQDDARLLEQRIRALEAAEPVGTQAAPVASLLEGAQRVVNSIDALSGVLQMFGDGSVNVSPSPGTLSLWMAPDLSLVFPSGSSKQSYNCRMGTAWVASTAVVPYWWTIDSNGNLQKCTTAGTTGAAAPTWATTVGAATTDGTAVWTLDTLGPFTTSTVIFSQTYPDSPDFVDGSDVGKTIRIMGPLGDNSDRAALDGTIETVNATAGTCTVTFTAPTRGLSYASAFWWPPDQDDTAAIQAAVNSGYRARFASGVFIYSGQIDYSSNLQIFEGMGMGRTTFVLNSQTTETRFINFTDCSGVRLMDFQVFGPGVNSAYGGGIKIAATIQADSQVFLERVGVYECASEGIEVLSPIVCELRDCSVAFTAAQGIDVEEAVSVGLYHNYSETSGVAAFFVKNSYDIALVGNAAEASGIEYNLVGCSGVFAAANDSEAGVNRVVSPPGALASVAASGAGTLPAGTWTLYATFVRQVVANLSLVSETMPSPAAAGVALSGSQGIAGTVAAAPSSQYPYANVYAYVPGVTGASPVFLAQIAITTTGSTAFTISAPPTGWPGTQTIPWYAARGHSWVIDDCSQVRISDCSVNNLPSSDCRHFLVGNDSSAIAIEGVEVLTGGTAPAFDIEVDQLPAGTAYPDVSVERCYLPHGISGSPNWLKDSNGDLTWGGSLQSNGAVEIAAGGTNESITLTPSGTGTVTINPTYAPALVMSSGAYEAESVLVTVAGTFAPEASASDLVVRTNSGRMIFNTNWGASASTLFISGTSVGVGTVTPAHTLDVIGGNIGNSAGQVSLAAGGTNQNITLAPSGTGSTILNGNVGIGTTAPIAALVVSNAGAQGIELFPNNFSFGTMIQGYNRSTATYLKLDFNALSYGFRLSSASADAVTIASGGNVGVGTAAPASAFSVGGASQFQVGATGSVAALAANATVGDGVPAVLAKVALTAQSAVIAATNVITPPAAGLYRVSVYLVVTAAGTGGAIQANVGWKDEALAQSDSVATLSTALGARAHADFVVHAETSAAITYSTVFNSVTGSPAYSLYVTVEKIG